MSIDKWTKKTFIGQEAGDLYHYTNFSGPGGGLISKGPYMIRATHLLGYGVFGFGENYRQAEADVNAKIEEEEKEREARDASRRLAVRSIQQ